MIATIREMIWTINNKQAKSPSYVTTGHHPLSGEPPAACGSAIDNYIILFHKNLLPTTKTRLQLFAAEFLIIVNNVYSKFFSTIYIIKSAG